MRLEKGNLNDLTVFYDEHHGRLKVSFEVMVDALSGWDVWILDDDGPKAIIITKNGYGHISAYRGLVVGTARMKLALDKLGINRTTVSGAFKKGHSLAKRLGFHVEMTEKGVTHYVRNQDNKK